tara:strand:+ start:21 stop:557 length:537 start_codon:yes stop_codon:yes gene_type:complete
MEIYKKLFEAKKEIGAISKESTNPFFKSKYFDINQLLEHVEPILQKHNLLLLQPIEDNVVISRIIDIDSGEITESSMSLTAITDPQKRGSEITYYRRYTLGSLLGLQAVDDDANIASKAPTQIELPWLNATEKDGTETKKFANVKTAIDDGRIKSLADVRKVYKVNKDVAVLIENLLK